MKQQIMFTIDLLKGEGVPAKSRPQGIAITTVAVVVPLLVAVWMLSHYLNDRTVITIYRYRIANYDSQLNKLAGAVESQKSFKKQQNILTNSLLEAASFSNNRLQWSSILAILAGNIPDSVVLTELDVKQNTVRKQVPREGNPGEMVNVRVLKKTLGIGVCGKPDSDCAQDVRDFRNRLLFSDLLGPKLEDIMVSQQVDTLGGEDVVSYEIDCIFKSIL